VVRNGKILISVRTITKAKQCNRQGGARAMDLPARSFELVRPGVAPPLNRDGRICADLLCEPVTAF